MRLLVVIVNFRTPGLAVDCLRSLVGEVSAARGERVVVVENGSGDDSFAQIAEAIAENGWSDWCCVVAERENRGFAAGNNVAIRPALEGDDPPEYVLLLNSDTVVRPGALAALVDVLERRPEIGIVGSRLEDPDGTPQCSAYRFPGVASELDDGLRFGPASKLLRRYVVLPSIPNEALQVGWVAGASMLIRREVFDDIGIFDDRYFLYYEEVDFCLRAARAGWKCWYEPASRVVHLVGRSSGVTNAQAKLKRRPKYWFDSRRRYFLKNYGKMYSAAADLAWGTSYPLWYARAKLQRKPITDPPRLWRDFVAGSVFAQGFRL